MKKFSLILLIFISYNSFCQDNDIFFFIKDKNCEIQNCKLDKDRYTNVNISNIENVLEEHIIYYENNGYPLVDAKLDSIKGNKADLVVNKGQKYTIDSLVIYGNTNISEKQLLQLIGIKKGEIYNQKKLLNRIKTMVLLLSLY